NPECRSGTASVSNPVAIARAATRFSERDRHQGAGFERIGAPRSHHACQIHRNRSRRPVQQDCDYDGQAMWTIAGYLCALALASVAAAGQGQAGAAPLRLLVVTGGHDYPTSFYTLFEQPGMMWDH